HTDPTHPNPTRDWIDATINQVVYFLDLVKQKLARPRDDMMTRLLDVEVANDDGSTARLIDEEIAGFSTLIAAAGSETVTKQVGNGVVLFGRNPGEWRKALDDPAKMTGAVEEVLRYW